MSCVHVKIEGLCDAAQAVRMVEMGADAIGFVFADSPRRVTPAKARRIIDSLPPGAKCFTWTVGVFVNADVDEINRTVRESGITHVQLHGDEPPEIVSRIEARCLKAFRIRSADWADEVEAWLGGLDNVNHLAGIVLDAYAKAARGGTGERFNWNWVADVRAAGRLDDAPPIILAGGLDPDCIAEAVSVARPWGVDVASGVERSPGVKDLAKVKAFIERAGQTRLPNCDSVVERCLRHRRLTRLASILHRHPDLTRQRPSGEPVLHRAWYSCMSLLPWLLARGVCPDQRDESEGTLLMAAAAENDINTIALLLTCGADPSARNTSGETPFSYACANGSFESAHLLRAAGAEINTVDTGGGTPLDWAKYYASKRFYDWLVSIGCEHRDSAPGYSSGC